jgi:hypothetical protein
MSKPYETRALSLIVLPEGEAIFSEQATTITIEDDAGGEFIVIEQQGLADAGKIRIDPMEWPAIRGAIDRMIGECRPLQTPA